MESRGPHTSSLLCPSLGVPLRSQWHSQAVAMQHKTSGLGGSLDLGLGTGQGEDSGAKTEAQGRGWAGLSTSGRQAQPPAPEKWAVKSTASPARRFLPTPLHTTAECTLPGTDICT